MSQQVVRRYPDNPHMRFSLGVETVHPSVTPDEVTRALGWEPGWTWEPGFDPAGDADRAKAGFGWGMRQTYSGERLFFRRVVAMVEDLEGRGQFVRTYVETGGELVFTVRLFGQVNIGDAISPEDLIRMAMLGIALQVEVVPEWE